MEKKMTGAICGGVISETMLKRGMKKDVYFGMMSFVMPDKQYKKFIVYRNQHKGKEAKKLFNRYAISQI